MLCFFKNKLMFVYFNKIVILILQVWIVQFILHFAYYIINGYNFCNIKGEIYVKNYICIYDKYKNNKYNFNNSNISNTDYVASNELAVNTEVGYIELFVFTDRGQVPVEDAVITIYARRGEVNEVPVLKVRSQMNPFKVELPVAHPLGTLIEGPEYYFSTYNLTIEKPGFYSITVKNIRLFPGVTVQFSYNLNRLLPGVSDRQETIAIPPHPRDVN